MLCVCILYKNCSIHFFGAGKINLCRYGKSSLIYPILSPAGGCLARARLDQKAFYNPPTPVNLSNLCYTTHLSIIRCDCISRLISNLNAIYRIFIGLRTEGKSCNLLVKSHKLI